MPHIERETRSVPPETESLAFHELQVLTPLSLADLLGGQPFPRNHLADFGIEIYHQIADKSLHPVVAYDAFGQVQELIVVCPQITGYQMCGLFYAGAPSKKYGGSKYSPFDRNDTKSDWRNLFNPDIAIQKARLERHRHIPGWMAFEAKRLDLYSFVEDNALHSPLPENLENTPRLTPLLRINLSSDTPQIMIEDLSSRQFNQLQELVSDRSLKPEHTAAILGVVFAAAYAPDITHAPNKKYGWAKRLKIPGHTKDDQDMGPTQFLPLALWKAQTLTNSVFIKQVCQYAQTSEIASFGMPKFEDGVADSQIDNIQESEVKELSDYPGGLPKIEIVTLPEEQVFQSITTPQLSYTNVLHPDDFTPDNPTIVQTGDGDIVLKLGENFEIMKIYHKYNHYF